MSLFKTKEWWRTVCGVNESFDKRSLLVAPFFGQEKKDVVIVGSHSGYLRMYKPSSEWMEETNTPSRHEISDLMIETKICECIIDMKIGKFVSGSQDLRLAVLTPTKLAVYNATLTEGSAEHGDRCDLQIAYEHSLPRFPASLTTGPFGSVRGRDFMCVQCLDGTLLFYEQEVFAFSQVLRNRLLPEPIVYLARNDVFVTASSSWILECYRYQSMAESVRSRERSEAEGGGALEPDWSFNIGEAVLDIDSVTLSSFEHGIVVLGEKNLFCLKDGCVALKYAKRLDYKPLRLRAYVIEPDGKLMALVIADTNTLMIYEGTTLKWSAQLPFPPVAVARAHLQHLQGAIILLSEDGRLEACYLGSEPALFVAPPLHRRGYDYVAAEKELAELRAFLRKSKGFGEGASDAMADTELVVSLNVSPNLEARAAVEKEGFKETAEGRQLLCRMTIELSSYATLRDIQVCIDVCRPLRVTKDFHSLPTLCDRHAVQTTVYVEDELPCVSSEITATVSYRTDRGNLRVLQKAAQLPLKMMLRTCSPENTSAFTATIKCAVPLIGFGQLFPELTGEQPQKQNWNALGLQHVTNGATVSIVCGSSSNRYRVQSNDGPSMALVLRQLANRLRDKARGSLVTSVAQNHVQLVHSRMEAHFLSRQEIDRITAEIGLLTSQLRNIERRMLRAVRERNARSLSDTGLPFLLEATYSAIFALLEDLARAKAERERTGHGVRCALSLLLTLVRLNASDDDKYALLVAATGFEAQLRDQPQDWEEMADVGLSALLRSTSRKTGNADTKALVWSRVTSGKELAKLKKRLAHAVERLDSSRESDIAESQEHSDGSTPVLP